MQFIDFQNKAKAYPLFTIADVLKWYPEAAKPNVLNQLNLWVKKKYLVRLKRGIYALSGYTIQDPFVLAEFLYHPSYVSLESALNAHGMIPDIPFQTTCVTLQKTAVFATKEYGSFFYHHTRPELFFGFHTIVAQEQYSYNMASPEKALFDYLYLKGRGAKSEEAFIKEMRLSIPDAFNCNNLKQWRALVSQQNKTFHKLVDMVLSLYD
jgi:predicted transcriptional regulator of viral defense system